MGDWPERAQHWDLVYGTRDPKELSWYEPTPQRSMQLIGELGVGADVAVIDVGGGESTFVDHLLAAAFVDLTVLDISAVAVADGHRRLGTAPVKLMEADVLTWQPERTYGLWHDRAVFHFLVDDEDRAAYLRTMRAATAPGSAVIVATFGPEGPESCSGLPVIRYSATELAAALGEGFDVIATLEERHVTPANAVQPFTWVAGRLSAPSNDGDR